MRSYFFLLVRPDIQMQGLIRLTQIQHWSEEGGGGSRTALSTSVSEAASGPSSFRHSPSLAVWMGCVCSQIKAVFYTVYQGSTMYFLILSQATEGSDVPVPAITLRLVLPCRVAMALALHHPSCHRSHTAPICLSRETLDLAIVRSQLVRQAPTVRYLVPDQSKRFALQVVR